MSKGCNSQNTPRSANPISCSGIKILSVILFLANIFQIIIGVVTIVLINYYEFRMCRFMHSIQQKELNSELSFTYIFGMQMIVAYCYGICISKKIINGSDRLPLTYLLTLWNIYNFLLIFYALIMISKLSVAENSIISTTELYMLKGIDIYYIDPEWRLTWDSMQFHENCCGARTFTDWEHSSGFDFQPKLFRDKNSLDSVVPFSCCQTALNCFNDTNKYANICGLPETNVDSQIFKCCGCIELFADLLHLTILIFFVILGIVFVLQCFILILMRTLWSKVKIINCSNDSENIMNVKYVLKNSSHQNLYAQHEVADKFPKIESDSECDYEDNSPLLVH